MSIERYEKSKPVVLAENLPLQIEMAKTGNKQAEQNILEFLRPRFVRYFARSLPNLSEDLSQEVLIRVSQNLTKFGRKPRRGTVIQNFNSWSYGIARHVLFNELRRMYKERHYIEQSTHIHAPSLTNNQHPVDVFSLYSVHMVEKIDEILPKREQRIIKLALTGKTNSQIAGELGLAITTVEDYIVNGRKRIEEKILFPTGYKPVFIFKDNTLSSAASNGSLDAVKFLRRWYTTDEAVGRYNPRRQIVDQTLVDQGLILLHQHTSLAEYVTLTLPYKHSEMVKKQGGRLWIRAEDLERWRQKRNKTVDRGIETPDGYMMLKDFVSTAIEYETLLRAASNGKLKTMKKGNWWFAAHEAIDEFRKSNQKSVTE